MRRFGNDLVVPHVGWNRIHRTRSHELFEGVEDGSFCYFVHSYYCEPEDGSVVTGETDYGGRYASVVAKGNVCGVQFHPEKSQEVGLKMLRNFGSLMCKKISHAKAQRRKEPQETEVFAALRA